MDEVRGSVRRTSVAKATSTMASVRLWPEKANARLRLRRQSSVQIVATRRLDARAMSRSHQEIPGNEVDLEEVVSFELSSKSAPRERRKEK